MMRIFTNNGSKQSCTKCHKGTSAPEGMSLEAGKAYSMIVNVASKEKPSLKRVLPGDANNSYLYQKVVGSPTFKISDARMQRDGGALSDVDIALIRDWISGVSRPTCSVLHSATTMKTRIGLALRPS